MLILLRENINALRDMNELWVTRLEELSEQMQEIEDQTMKNFLKQGNKEDRQLMKLICEERKDLKAA